MATLSPSSSQILPTSPTQLHSLCIFPCLSISPPPKKSTKQMKMKTAIVDCHSHNCWE